jgi:hypothetical protein
LYYTHDINQRVADLDKLIEHARTVLGASLEDLSFLETLRAEASNMPQQPRQVRLSTYAMWWP